MSQETPGSAEPAVREESGAAQGAVILGPGRSGTSATARAFVLAGFFAGEEGDVLGPAPSNPRGHYEPLPILRANEALLAELDCYWWSDTPHRDAQLALRRRATPQLQRLLEAQMASAQDRPIVVKEPRIGALLPLWAPVIDETLHPVLAVRDPVEVALSLERRDGISVGHALAGWEAITAQTLDFLAGRVVTVAPYEKLSAEPDLAADVVTEAIGRLGDELAQGLEPTRARTAYERSLRHENASRIRREEYLTGHQAELWDFLSHLPLGNVELTVPAALRNPTAFAQGSARREGERLHLAGAYAGALDQLTRVKAEADDLESQLEQVRDDLAAAREAAGNLRAELDHVANSASWRLTSPLRRAKGMLGQAPAHATNETEAS